METQTNTAKMETFVHDLKEAGLFRYFSLLKGGTGAIQLQHVMRLKEAARRGPEAFKDTLAELGVESPEDRDKLLVFLMSKLRAYGGLPVAKVMPEAKANTDTDAWRQALSSPKGQLPEAYARHHALEEAPPQREVPEHLREAEAVAVRLGMPPGMRIVNHHMVASHGGSIREQGMYQDGNSLGYIHLAGEVERSRPILGNSHDKTVLLGRLKEAAVALQRAHPRQVRRTDVFDAFIIPPGSKEGRRVISEGQHDIHVAEFDVAILVECEHVEAAAQVRQSAAFAELKALLDAKARFVHCITARNPKRIDEVDHTRDGVFLFNYFYAADVPSKAASGTEILLSVWEYTAGWWTAKANLDNSAPLQPIDGERSQYSLINHCRWDSKLDIFPHIMFRPTMDHFVLGNFTANDIMAMPILYHLA